MLNRTQKGPPLKLQLLNSIQLQQRSMSPSDFGYVMIMSLRKQNDVKVEHEANNEHILNSIMSNYETLEY